MINDQYLYHNINSIEHIPGIDGVALYRVPEPIRHQLNDRARCVAKQSTGCEIRFVSDSPHIEAFLRVLQPEWGGKGKVNVYKGDYLVQTHTLEPGVHQRIRLETPAVFSEVDEAAIKLNGFSPKVWRICFDKGLGVFHGIDVHGYECRPPKDDEMPRLKWLAYGSSITQSSMDGYVHVAAKRLKMDVQNKGLAGSCLIEPVMTEWLSQTCDWDIITCEMGVNMRDLFSPEQFKERAEKLLSQLTSDHPDKPIIAINVFPNVMTQGWANPENQDRMEYIREQAYNRIIPDIVKEIGTNNLHFIDGAQILDDFTGLSADLLHPDIYGHGLMGHNLAKIMKRILSL
jgi:hypothetical protein